jgi:hypothetical protein
MDDLCETAFVAGNTEVKDLDEQKAMQSAKNISLTRFILLDNCM